MSFIQSQSMFATTNDRDFESAIAAGQVLLLQKTGNLTCCIRLKTNADRHAQSRLSMSLFGSETITTKKGGSSGQDSENAGDRCGDVPVLSIYLSSSWFS
eukprot:764672-Hanusia_phi.AAC.2